MAREQHWVHSRAPWQPSATAPSSSRHVRETSLEDGTRWSVSLNRARTRSACGERGDRPVGGMHPAPSQTPGTARCRGTPWPGRVPVHPELGRVPSGAVEEAAGMRCACRAGGGSRVVGGGRAAVGRVQGGAQCCCEQLRWEKSFAG